MDMFFALATASASCSLGFLVKGFEEAMFAWRGVYVLRRRVGSATLVMRVLVGLGKECCVVAQKALEDGEADQG
jgi:hypothetical protein